METAIESGGEDDIACIRNISELLYCGACGTGLIGDGERIGKLPALQR